MDFYTAQSTLYTSIPRDWLCVNITPWKLLPEDLKVGDEWLRFPNLELKRTNFLYPSLETYKLEDDREFAEKYLKEMTEGMIETKAKSHDWKAWIQTFLVVYAQKYDVVVFMTRDDTSRAELQRKVLRALLNKYLQDGQCRELSLRMIEEQKRKKPSSIGSLTEALF